MFTWICPQCGREVPPAYNDCPDCAKRTAGSAQGEFQPPAQGAPPPPDHPPLAGPQDYVQSPPPVPQQPPLAPAPPPPQYPVGQQYSQQPPQAPPQYYAPPQQGQPGYPPQPHRGMQLPVWLMTIVFALAIAGVVFGIRWLVTGNRGSAGDGPAPIAAVENPAAKPGAKTNSLQKFIEISGVRFVQDAKKKTQAKFVVVNHSEADINGLSGNVTIWGRTQKSEEDAQGSFTFNTNLGPFESKELTVPLDTKRKIYELADWQNITTDVQITGPGQ